MLLGAISYQIDIPSMKTIAVIGASYLQRPLVEKAKEMGFRVICFAWREGAVCADIADIFYPVSIIEKDEIFAICRKEKIDGICTIASDVAAPTVAYVAEKMGLNANSYEVALRANNKFAMREVFSRAGVKCPGYAKVSKGEGLYTSGWKFPLIVKPCDRSGSLGVEKVLQPSRLEEAIKFAQQCSFKHEAIVEEFIEGREISVEFISFKGVHYPLAITDKVTTEAPHFVELEHHQPAEFSYAMYEEIYATTKKALDALGVSEGASHTEYKITADNQIYIIELGARMGGDFIGSDLVRLSTGYDFVKGVINVALAQFEVPAFSGSHHSGVYFLCKETERLLPIISSSDNPEWAIRKEITGTELKIVKCSADRSGYLIYQSDKKIII